LERGRGRLKREEDEERRKRERNKGGVDKRRILGSIVHSGR
jgi:hypothetical protein